MPIHLLAACGPLARNWPERVDYPILEADVRTDAPANPERLRVMAWNVKYGAGRIDFWFDGWGDRVSMSADEVHANLDDIRALVREFQPDILVTEEIEVDSKRSAYIDMVDNLLNDPTLGFNYAGYTPNWQVAYVPDHGLGKVDMGQAVFSKYPITANVRVDLGPIEEQDALTRIFYLDRCITVDTIDLGDGTVTVLGVHPDAYSTDGTKLRQVAEIYAEAMGIDGDVIVAGDLNVIPPGTLRLEGFADEASVDGLRGVGTTDYLSEEEQHALDDWYANLEEATELDHGDGGLTLAGYTAATLESQQVPWYTHSISGSVFWTRRLDYLFSNLGWSAGLVVQSPGDGRTVSLDGTPIPTLDPMDLSDHAPVFGVLERR